MCDGALKEESAWLPREDVRAEVERSKIGKLRIEHLKIVIYPLSVDSCSRLGLKRNDYYHRQLTTDNVQVLSPLPAHAVACVFEDDAPRGEFVADFVAACEVAAVARPLSFVN